jgi:hypothetical protein
LSTTTKFKSQMRNYANFTKEYLSKARKLYQNSQKPKIPSMNVRKSIFFLLVLNFSAFAQYKLGISTSNYAGTNGLAINPSNLADSRFKYYFNIAGFDQSISNNLVKWQGDFPMWVMSAASLGNTNLLKKLAPDNVTAAGKLFVPANLDGESAFRIKDKYKANVNAQGSLDINLVSAQFDSEKIKGTAGISLKLRNNVSFRNTNNFLGALIVNGLTSNVASNSANQTLLDYNTETQINSFFEFGLSYGRVLMNDESQQLKLGGTLKYYGGLLNLGFDVKNADIRLTPRSGTVTSGTQTLTAYNVDVVDADRIAMYVTSESSVKPFLNGISASPGKFLNPFFIAQNLSGHGLGGDLGLTYEYFDDEDTYISERLNTRRYKNIEKTVNKYKFKLGVSLLDLGFIKYGGRDDQSVKYFDVNKETNPVHSSILDIYGLNKMTFKPNAEPFIDDWFKEASLLTDLPPNFGGYTISAPTAISIQGDYKVIPNVYLGGLLIQNMGFVKKAYTMHAPSTLAVIPRYERKYFEASLPLMMTNRYNNFQVGLGLRAGPVYVGTDHLFSMLYATKVQGTSFYFGASVPILHKPVLREAQDLAYDDTRSLIERIREYFRKRHLRKLHKKAMTEG